MGSTIQSLQRPQKPTAVGLRRPGTIHQRGSGTRQEHRRHLPFCPDRLQQMGETRPSGAHHRAFTQRPKFRLLPVARCRHHCTQPQPHYQVLRHEGYWRVPYKTCPHIASSNGRWRRCRRRYGRKNASPGKWNSTPKRVR